MKGRNIIAIATILGMLAALAASGTALAAGRQSGKRYRSQATSSGTNTATRPADSQRRDGTFATTGTTANGSTTRPSKGRGVQDGSRLNQ